MNPLQEFQDRIGLTFNDITLLERAFIHRSYLNEHPKLGLEHNERLEFLGDAVLELVVTDFLYRNYPNPEGDLTNWRSALVKTESLAAVAESSKLPNTSSSAAARPRAMPARTRSSRPMPSRPSLAPSTWTRATMPPSFHHRHIISRLPEILEDRHLARPQEQVPGTRPRPIRPHAQLPRAGRRPAPTTTRSSPSASMSATSSLARLRLQQASRQQVAAG
jgi:hypothetical protein